MSIRDLTSSQLAGQLLVGGIPGDRLTPRFQRAMAAGERGGWLLFRRNLPTPEAALALNQAVVAIAPPSLPPWVGIDAEGGRVFHLPAPFVRIPTARALGATGDVERIAATASHLGQQLAAAGFSIDFAPVLDVDSNLDNPVIGDRAFATTAGDVARFGLAFARGLGAHVASCGKHFPGHGDTDCDSHLERPLVSHDQSRLDAVELAPFRAAIAANVPTLMSAHVVFSAWDPHAPATLSYRIGTELLRNALGFSGVLFSDDLEMKAITAYGTTGEAAVAAVEAGCDVLLVTQSEDALDEAHEALLRRVEQVPSFRARCEEALERALVVRRRYVPRPCADMAALSAILNANRSKTP